MIAVNQKVFMSVDPVDDGGPLINLRCALGRCQPIAVMLGIRHFARVRDRKAVGAPPLMQRVVHGPVINILIRIDFSEGAWAWLSSAVRYLINCNSAATTDRHTPPSLFRDPERKADSNSSSSPQAVSRRSLPNPNVQTICPQCRQAQC